MSARSDQVMEVSLDFRWRARERRPALEVEIAVAPRSAWALFRAYHYLSAELSPAAHCYVLSVAGRPAAFAAVINFMHPSRRDIRRITRVVVLPDWQGLGLGPILLGKLGASHRGRGLELRIATGSAAFARTLRQSADWVQVARGTINQVTARSRRQVAVGAQGGKCISSFFYAGPAGAGELL
jgi:GNAT superfamily N-acetyltransferase